MTYIFKYNNNKYEATERRDFAIELIKSGFFTLVAVKASHPEYKYHVTTTFNDPDTGECFLAWSYEGNRQGAEKCWTSRSLKYHKMRIYITTEQA